MQHGFPRWGTPSGCWVRHRIAIGTVVGHFQEISSRARRPFYDKFSLQEVARPHLYKSWPYALGGHHPNKCEKLQLRECYFCQIQKYPPKILPSYKAHSASKMPRTVHRNPTHLCIFPDGFEYSWNNWNAMVKETTANVEMPQITEECVPRRFVDLRRNF